MTRSNVVPREIRRSDGPRTSPKCLDTPPIVTWGFACPRLEHGSVTAGAIAYGRSDPHFETSRFPILFLETFSVCGTMTKQLNHAGQGCVPQFLYLQRGTTTVPAFL